MQEFKILQIDLTNKEFNTKNISRDIIKKWGAGRGLGSYLILELIKEGKDPRDHIFILNGLLSGIVGMVSPSRAYAVFISPITNNIFYSSVGGGLAHALSRTEYIGIEIYGRSEKPVYVLVNEDPKILDANDLWGKGIHEVTKILQEEYKNPDVSVIAIGPAGENLVKFANVIVDSHNAFGRGGLGYLFGSKKLKAIVTLPYKPAKILKPDIDVIKRVMNNVVIKDLSNEGTYGMLYKRLRGKIPTNNFKDIDSEEYYKTYEKWKSNIKKSGCKLCIIQCKKKYKDLHGIEYWGGFVSLGSLLGWKDIECITKVYNLANDLGLDAISVGYTIAAFKEVIKNTNISVEYNLDRCEDIERLIKDIAFRRGIGKILSEGSRYLDKYYNIEVSVTYRGIDVSLCIPKGLYAYPMSIITNTRGDQHQVMLKDEILLKREQQKEKYVIDMQNKIALVDSLGLCVFTLYELDYTDYYNLLVKVYGDLLTFEEFIKIGERIFNTEKYINILLGENKDISKKAKEILNINLERYYRLRGWDDFNSKLKELEII